MLQVRLFGTLEVTDSHGRLATAVLAQPKRAALLAYLALATADGFVRRDTVLALFWPDADSARARRALNQAIHHLRSALGADAIVTRGEDLSLDHASCRCDVNGFRE